MKPYLIKNPKLISKCIYPELHWHIATHKKEIFLTFDDGPTPGVTEKILKILHHYQAKATFFLVGDKVKNNLKLIDEVLNENHSIGNHTFNHLNGWKTNSNLYIENVEQANHLINSKFFRPPYGRIKKEQIEFLKDKYHIIMWSLLSADFDVNITPEQCYQNINNKVQSGDIIVFHDSMKAKDRVLYTLPRIIEEYLKKGYEFNSITEDHITHNE